MKAISHALILTLFCCGCLAESKSPPTVPDTAVSVLDVTSADADEGSQSQFTDDQEQGFTGGVVYGDPATCVPCANLVADLRWLSNNYQWTLGFYGEDGYTGREDWIIERPDQSPARTPMVVFYRAGVPVDQVTGYTASEDPDERKTMLKELVQRHPTPPR